MRPFNFYRQAVQQMDYGAGCQLCARVSIVKKYLVYTYYVGRPMGGAKDYLDAFESVAEALDNILEERARYYQIVDRETMEVVKEGLARFKNFPAQGFERH